MLKKKIHMHNIILKAIKKDLRCLSNPFMISGTVSKQDTHSDLTPRTVGDTSDDTL